MAVALGVDLRIAAVRVEVYVATSQGAGGLEAACSLLSAWLAGRDEHDDGDDDADDAVDGVDTTGLLLGGALAAAHADVGGPLPLDPYLETREPAGGVLEGGPLVTGVLVPQLPRGCVSAISASHPHMQTIGRSTTGRWWSLCLWRVLHTTVALLRWRSRRVSGSGWNLLI